MSPTFGGLGRDALASIKEYLGLAYRLGAHAPSHIMSEGQVGVDNSNLWAQDGTAALGARAIAIRRGRMKLNERTQFGLADGVGEKQYQSWI